MPDQPDSLTALLDGIRFAMFTTTCEDGSLASRPMTIQEVTGGEIVFISQAGTDVAKQSHRQQVNLAIADGTTWVSIAGTAEVSDDRPTKQRLWDSANDAFTEGGPDNPENVVIRVRAQGAEYWDTPGGVGIVLGVLKAKLTGDKPDLGEHGTIEA